MENKKIYKRKINKKKEPFNIFPQYSPKTIGLVAIFLTLLAVANIYIYFYRQQIGPMVEKYVSEITICENITDENQCYQNDFCEGIYNPGCTNCGLKPAFVRCERKTQKDQDKREILKNLCIKTGGQWYRNKLMDDCLCSTTSEQKIFDKVKGCINK